MSATSAPSVGGEEPTDPLTGLPTADVARATLSAWLGAPHRHVHAMLLSLGRFDSVNLVHGSDAGDLALKDVARRMLVYARDEFEFGEALVARLDGGKFLIASRERCSRERWQFLAEALADAVTQPVAAGSLGLPQLWPHIALIRSLDSDDATSLLDRLSDAVFDLRGVAGRQVVWIDRDIAPAGLAGPEIEAALRAAIEAGEVSLAYQPLYALADDRLVGAEALVRWTHPVLGQVGGEALLRIAARADVTTQLTRLVIEQAVQAMGDWPEHLKCALNVTAADLAVQDFPDALLRVVGRSSIAPKRLVLEITEQTLLGDLDLAARSLAKLRAAGISIALDDFGAGFCNFGYLKYLPLDAIKLDRAMIDGVAEDERDRAVLRAVIAMANALDLAVTAEGIETEAQRKIAAEEGCTTYQGFLKARPLSSEAFQALIAEG